MPQPRENPSLVIFSSSKLISIAETIRDNLSHSRLEGVSFTVTPWTEGFFRSNEVPLNTFLKNLLCYDAAVVVLGADDLRQNTVDDIAVCVPRDNVVFELGACMARLGTQKTFIVVPADPKVVLPSYFKGVYPLEYESREDRNLDAAVGGACRAIRAQFERLDRNAYYSDLPAQGLAFGYFQNFLRPTYQRLRTSQTPINADGDWLPDNGFCISVVMPPAFWGRDRVGDEMTKRKLTKLELHLLDGRDVSVYRGLRAKTTDRLEIFDIPTTLMTSQRVIDKVDAFWGTGEKRFKEQLEKRELTNFCRAITDIIAEDRELREGCMPVLNMQEFDSAITSQA